MGIRPLKSPEGHAVNEQVAMGNTFATAFGLVCTQDTPANPFCHQFLKVK